MKAVADTNTFLSVALYEPEREAIIRSTADSNLISPEILPYEIGNAISKMVKRDLASPNKALEIFEFTQRIPVQLKSINISQALKISSRFQIYAYDAYFLQCAIENNAPIISLDQQMLKVARELNIKILEIS